MNYLQECQNAKKWGRGAAQDIGDHGGTHPGSNALFVVLTFAKRVDDHNGTHREQPAMAWRLEPFPLFFSLTRGEPYQHRSASSELRHR